MRVSKADGSQVFDLQRDGLIAAGVTERHLSSETASGKKDDRPGLAACLQSLREGDTLVVWKLDRLGRNLRHLVNIVHELTAAGGKLIFGKRETNVGALCEELGITRQTLSGFLATRNV